MTREEILSHVDHTLLKPEVADNAPPPRQNSVCNFLLIFLQWKV